MVRDNENASKIGQWVVVLEEELWVDVVECVKSLTGVGWEGVVWGRNNPTIRGDHTR